MAIKDSILAEYDHEVGTTRKLLERLPDDNLGWKPHPKSMSFGELGTHLANLSLWTGNVLNESFFDLDGVTKAHELTSRADILRAFDDSTKRARAWMDKTDAEYVARWSLRRGGQEMFSMPRVSALRSFVMNHLIHHRGQLSVYLRLNDISVPPIYGPTADEGV
jgi:uncharacterized damage-inducible protein DinB